MTPSEGAARVAELELAKAGVIARAAYDSLERTRASADALPAAAVAGVEASYRLALLDEEIARVRLEVARRRCEVEAGLREGGQ